MRKLLLATLNKGKILELQALLESIEAVLLTPQDIGLDMQVEEMGKTYAENGVIVAGGLGDFAGKVFRMGHMGNLSFSQVYFALDALKKTLVSIGYLGKSKSNVRMTESEFEAIRNRRNKQNGLKSFRRYQDN